MLVSSTTADAAGLIRDAETEALIRTYAKPIFAAAGLGSQAIEIHIVNDRSFNAFVVDGHNMFIHAGALMGAKTPNEVIGVIAHESGHITGGHLARLRTQMSRAKSAALMLQLLGLAAMAAGALGGAPGIGQAGMGVAYGGEDAAMRSILAYRQDEESSADQAGVSFLNATHQSGRGMLVTFEAMSTKLIGVQGINPYLQSHPMPQQRLTQLRELVTSSPYYNAVDPPELQFRHDLVKAKLYGFLDTPEVLFNRYPQTDQSLAAQYARAIATYRKSGVKVRHAAVGYADRCPAQLAVFLRDQRAVPVRERQSGRRGGAASPGRQPRPQRAPHPRHARPGPARHQRCQARRRGHHQPSHRARPRGFLVHGLPPARRGLCAQGRHKPGR